MAAMNRQETELVEKHLCLVRDTVLGTVTINESVQGLGYDDLYQTACEALCHAAQKYRADGGASFPTFASVVIKNRLISQCRKATRMQRPLEYMDAPQSDGSDLTFAEPFPTGISTRCQTQTSLSFSTKPGNAVPASPGKGWKRWR